MYCSGCGQLIESGQQACPRCGRPVSPAEPVSYAPAAPYPPRVARHLQTLGVLWLVYAGWSLLRWAMAATFLAGLFGMHGSWIWGHNMGPFGMGPFCPGAPFMHLSWLLPLITVITVGRAALAVITGIALLNHAPWGRVLAIVTGVLTVLKPITGTLLAAYTLWVLVPGHSAQEYDQLARR